jgi:glutamate/aspartate transport system substrate-binding protein
MAGKHTGDYLIQMNRRHRMKFQKLMIALIGVGMIAGNVHAANELTKTLKKIKDSGAITLGVRDASIPFSYSEDNKSYHGYAVDLCTKIATAVQAQLGMPSLNVKTVVVTTANRMQQVTSGAIDLECASTTNNMERQKSVAFSPTIFVTGLRLLVKKSSNIHSINDMKGKTVVATAASTNEKSMIEENKARQLGMKVVGVKDGAEAFQKLESGEAAAYAGNDIVLASMAATSKSSSDYIITQDAMTIEPYALVLRRDDPDFKKVVDATISAVIKSGEIERIYSKWFQSPIPPKGVNLNWPISKKLKGAFTQPTDSGDPATY